LAFNFLAYLTLPTSPNINTNPIAIEPQSANGVSTPSCWAPQ